MTLTELRKWVADDFLAATHQTMGQYRTALLRVIDDVIRQPFQARVKPWMLECFGDEIAADAEERNHRFLEEALELVQACGCTRSEAHQLVDYVFNRPVGEKQQEAGGVMVTLAALCLAQSLDMHDAGEIELARIWTKVEQIRAKQAAKPKHSPLPAAVPALVGQSVPEGILDALRFYANGSHFILSDDTAWDTVSGEPPNFWCDEAGTATVEDGSVAKLALQGKFFTDQEYTEPAVEGEVFAAAPEASGAAKGVTVDECLYVLEACVDLLLHDGVPLEHEHPKRIAVERARAILAKAKDQS